MNGLLNNLKKDMWVHTVLFFQFFCKFEKFSTKTLEKKKFGGREGTIKEASERKTRKTWKPSEVSG